MDVHLDSAERLLGALHPCPPERGGLDHAILTTVLLDALGDPDPPHTLAELLGYLEHRAPPGRVVFELVLLLRERLQNGPDLPLEACVARREACE